MNTSQSVFLGIGDLRKRWNYTRQAINQRIKEDKDFPLPFATINCGQTKIWTLEQIQAHEQKRPFLTERKVRPWLKVYMRSFEDYAKLSEEEKRKLAKDNPYSKFNKQNL